MQGSAPRASSALAEAPRRDGVDYPVATPAAGAVATVRGTTPRYTGRLIEWNDDRGFGFIETVDGKRRAFAHVSVFARNGRRPQRGDAVVFDATNDDRGRLRATHVEIPVAQSAASAASSGRTWIVPVVVVAVVAALAAAGRVPWWMPVLYAAASGAAFLAYGLDKGSAQAGGRRTPESTLHMLALFGGWPGAWVAQQAFRHKTQKTSFRVVYWVTVALNLLALAALAAGVISPYDLPGS